MLEVKTINVGDSVGKDKYVDMVEVKELKNALRGLLDNHSKTKIIAFRSQQESYEEPYFYIYFEVPENFDLDVEKFEKDFSEVYNIDDFEFDWNYAFYETAKKYGLDNEVGIEVIDLTI